MSESKYRVPYFADRVGKHGYLMALAIGLFMMVIVPVSCLKAIKPPPEASKVSELVEASKVTPAPPVDVSEITERKAAFFGYMRPIIREENSRILQDRKRLLSLYFKHLDDYHLPAKDVKWLKDLSQEYRVPPKLKDNKTWLQLIRRVDIVPEQLALVQSAVESQWGMSRFAVEGNSFFGEWCYEKNCGMVPERRALGKSHMVEVFGTANASVKSYLHNLNTHRAYKDFRSRRQALRKEFKPLEAGKLLPGLILYSERRDDYVRQIRKMMESNRALLEG